MSATDSFESKLAQLSPPQLQAIAGYIADVREQMLAARSEDARMRLLEEFQQESHVRLQGAR
jgi:hypothetical protein